MKQLYMLLWAVMLSLALKGLAPWPALIILLCKEAIMVLGGAVLYGKGGVVYANVYGKIAQTMAVSGLILCFFGEWFQKIGFPLHLIVLWCAVAMTLFALCVYARNAVRLYREADKKQ